MEDSIRISVQGLIKIQDKETGDILLDTHNDVLYGNMSTALAQSLIGNPNSFLFYIGFGNGGAYVSPTGTIAYKDTLGGEASLVKNPTANLYNTVYVKKLSNNSTGSTSYNQLSRAFVPSENYATNYEDIVVDVTLGYDEVPIGTSSSTDIQQSAIDSSGFVGSETQTNITSADPNAFVFNEIGLFAGSSNIFTGEFTQTVSDLNAFVNQTPDFSSTSGAKSKLMLTHVVFHPIQKSANRALQIIYTLRILMGLSQV